MAIQKWTLLEKKDVSPSSWFPIEERVYRMPSGKIVDDFTVTTLSDVAMIIPITTDRQLVLVNQYKPGVDEVMMQFPAGRLEAKHQNMDELAAHELEEEVGIKVESHLLKRFGKFTGFSTKATELVYAYFAENCVFNAKQKLDVTEEIEIVTVSFAEMEELIKSNKIWCSLTIACWELYKKRYPTT